MRERELGASCALAMGACLLALAGKAQAAPSVTGVSGAVLHGESIAIAGSGFGTKLAASPIIWDDFEGGIDGQSIHGKSPVIGPNWDTYTSHGVPPSYTIAANRANSSLCSLHDFVTNSQYNCSLEYWGTHSAVYFTFWWKYVKLQDYYNRNTKPWIEYGVKDGYYPLAYIGFGNPDYGDGGVRSSVQDVPSPTSPTLWGGTSISSINGQWIRIDQYLEQSSPNVADGTFMTWIHKPHAGSPAITFDLNSGEDQYMTRTRPYEWLQWHFGSYFAHDTDPYGGGQYAEAYYYIDDLYFDTTRARVEIGNASTWNACTHREMQIPSAWSSASITATVNQGGFADGQPVYLYVVDSNGNADPTGYSVTVGDVSFTLTVTNGAASGDYDEAEVVPISADPPASGKLFSRWIGDTSYIADRLGADTAVTMPATDISVTAVYAWGYQLTVNSGSGSGLYLYAAEVEIQADPAPSNLQFLQWTGDTSHVADVEAEATTFTIPNHNCEVTATYESALPGDLDGDGFVGQGDLDIILDEWGNSPPADPRADPSDDNMVGQADLDIVLDHWGEGTPSS